MSRPKQYTRDQLTQMGYTTPTEAARTLRMQADHIERNGIPQKEMVKYSIQIWFKDAKEDE